MVLHDVPAPAKINLFLHVTGRRPDGYHLLETVFRFVALCDVLNFETRRDGRITRELLGAPDLADIDPGSDLVVRAAQALQRATGTRQGAHIAYTKRIPAGGGLGGGSSDAATTLIALNRLWNTGLDRHQLMALALPLGADVPVFVHGSAAFATGIGEVLNPVQLPERTYVVVQPQQRVPTQAVFSAPDLTRNSAHVKIAVFTDWQKINAPVEGFHENGFFGRNDLEPVVFARYPRVARAAEWLSVQGVSARMSGSGACLFAEFATPGEAARFSEKIGKIKSRAGGEAVIGNVWVCQGLQDHPLRHWTRN
ncbi:4-(cytidine 5'-diphospho)-2-C-methyl-D-erythritol kinase [Allopusillimonas soli]|uniref:4-diphosphocytidyl-2-C-methyl-D-erythritol kinase n=1 Tax=Allopusillimonas soli TaxID=659016 RepID=A0A853F5D2_9BURK|nr:4-(cytidine 5'-diphospho)-2-C-methyl-D-erythritol kinase [Allopusillimonas soli]NYT35715.1 4-(cytidine 5'-diphospho)-2-C-methyl-D-erythritol kinase [Allopusillimonas soli]TEA76104.1 4-(cytidine 5'-diphospho)-2-C-methyl-D-erythritol kinase [Allopusillimonas soli]